ncbi:MAG: fused MFS/spermidine synthase [Crocinitomicaceae bacterium]|nr:fused MFS/spermidine synthase [Crocinitomicaceae bacterium]
MFKVDGKYFLLFLAFIEGASVMASELFGAKMIAPFFGSSLYVWAAVLGVTLFALMGGYYVGGYLSERKKEVKWLFWILMLGGSLILVMPYTSIAIMKNFMDSSVQTGSTLSLMLFLFPPLFTMGMSSPMIINLINENVDQSGKVAGKVYAISTLGGIVGTFLTGFYLLPELGMKWPCFGFGALMILVPLIGLLKLKVFKAAVFLLPLGLFSFMNAKPVKFERGNIELIYASEGILGQIRVYDMKFNTISRGEKNGRVLMVNNTAQTIHDVDNPTRDLWDYSYYFPTAASVYPPNSDVLLLGLGGGALLHHFNRLDFNTDVVELDQRIVDVAIQYFNVDPTTNIVVDDARRFINITEKKYDIIMMDLFHNETPPGHVLTLESFQRTKTLLKDGGMLMINFYGFMSGKEGRAARSIVKTLESANLQVEILPTPGNEGDRNLIFLAAPELPDFSKAHYHLDDLPDIENLPSKFIYKSTIDFSDAEILTDDRPLIEKLYLPAALHWRKVSNKYNLKKLIVRDMYFFI